VKRALSSQLPNPNGTPYEIAVASALPYRHPSPLFRADADDFIEGQDEYLAVADFACLGSLDDGVDRGFDKTLVHRDFEADLAQQVAHFLGAAVNFRHAFLAAMPQNLGDCHEVHVSLIQLVTDGIQFVRLYDRDDQFHSPCLSSCNVPPGRFLFQHRVGAFMVLREIQPHILFLRGHPHADHKIDGFKDDGRDNA